MRYILLILLNAVLVPCAHVQAQTYPSKPVRLIVPYPPGGTTDILARPLAQKLTEVFGKQVIVDNRGGANSIIGTDLMVRSQPDGHTLLMGTTATSSNAGLYEKLPYDTLRQIAPVSLVASTPYFLFAHVSLPASNVKELIALARSKPGQINFGSAGIGGTPHLTGEMFNVMAGVKLVHVPYKGTGPAVADLVAGQVQLMFTGLPSTVQFVQAGKLKILGVADPKRSAFMPNVPTIAESGLIGFEAASWFGILAPSGTPPAILNRLATEIKAIVSAPEMRERFLAMGAEPMWNTPREFAAFFREDVERWAKVVKASGAKAE
jgi:tripartite-type tricarboxylate transporter receptor subunit TctC